MLQGNYGLTNSNPVKIGNYRIFKTDFNFEEYFNILDEQNSLLLCKFRTTNHKLPIGKGRWSNIPRENRYCEFCQKKLFSTNNFCSKRNNYNFNVDFDRIST
jgi:hypothetical protein